MVQRREQVATASLPPVYPVAGMRPRIRTTSVPLCFGRCPPEHFRRTTFFPSSRDFSKYSYFQSVYQEERGGERRGPPGLRVAPSSRHPSCRDKQTFGEHAAADGRWRRVCYRVEGKDFRRISTRIATGQKVRLGCPRRPSQFVIGLDTKTSGIPRLRRRVIYDRLIDRAPRSRAGQDFLAAFCARQLTGWGRGAAGGIHSLSARGDAA